MKPNPDELLVIREAAEVAAVSPMAMRAAVEAGRVPSLVKRTGRLRRTTYVRRADAEAFTHPHAKTEKVRQERLKERRRKP